MDFPAFTTCPAGIITFTQGLSDMMFLCFQDEIRAFFSKRETFLCFVQIQLYKPKLCCYVVITEILLRTFPKKSCLFSVFLSVLRPV